MRLLLPLSEARSRWRAGALIASLCAAAGCASVEKGRPAEEMRGAAPASAEAAVRQDPAEARRLFEVALKRSAADPEGAAADFERAFQADPRLAAAAYDAGVLYERLGLPLDESVDVAQLEAFYKPWR